MIEWLSSERLKDRDIRFTPGLIEREQCLALAVFSYNDKALMNRAAGIEPVHHAPAVNHCGTAWWLGNIRRYVGAAYRTQEIACTDRVTIDTQPLTPCGFFRQHRLYSGLLYPRCCWLHVVQRPVAHPAWIIRLAKDL